MVKSLTSSPEWNMLFEMLEESSVSELQVNDFDKIFVKKSGKRRKVQEITIGDNTDEYIDSIQEHLAPLINDGTEFRRDMALYEGPISYIGKNGEEIYGRGHLVLDPAATYAPLFTFAKRSTSLLTLDHIMKTGAMNDQMLRFIKAAVYADSTIVFSGATGAGKTTFLEACTKLLPMDTRIGVCEDTPELRLVQDNVAYQKSHPQRPGMKAEDEITLQWVVKQVNRMRTDRIIVGEVRGKEFADFLVAANSGMEGSMITIHAEDSTQCLQKMTKFALQGSGENVGMRSVNIDIANSVHLIIQLSISATGKHYVKEITEVTKTVSSSDSTASITTQPLWKYDETNEFHEKVGSMTDDLRRKFKQKGIDVAEFLGQNTKAPEGAPFNEPSWLEGFGPDKDELLKERQISADPRFSKGSPEPQQGTRRRGLGRRTGIPKDGDRRIK